MTPPAQECGLIVFIRYPQLGSIKTRLAATVGNESALNIYNELVSLTLDTIRAMDGSVYLFYEGRLPVESERDPAFHYLIQSDGDLGQKMSDAMSHVLKHHSKAVIIGSDCPELTGEVIVEAFRSLDKYDIVIGPATDGGYYLIGGTSLYPFLFEDMAWSTPDVFKLTEERIHQHNLSLGILPELNDVDTEIDWLRYQSRKDLPGLSST